MKLSCILTINERPIPVLEAVFDSLKPQAHDELVIILDRTPIAVAEACYDFWTGDKRTEFVTLGGEPGWKCPAKAWNAGFKKATGDVFYCFSSETVQAEGNAAQLKNLLGGLEMTNCTFHNIEGGKPPTSIDRLILTQNLVIHGRCECSCGPTGQEVNWNGTAPGNLLGDAAHPRPLGFIWAAPAWAVHQIGGFDEAFDAGYWHDDSDYFLRLWRTGLDFVFDDSISGIHQHHERPVLSTPEGQEGIRKNTEYMLWKHGILHPWGENLPRTEEKKPGKTIWRHL